MHRVSGVDGVRSCDARNAADALVGATRTTARVLSMEPWLPGSPPQSDGRGDLTLGSPSFAPERPPGPWGASWGPVAPWMLWSTRAPAFALWPHVLVTPEVHRVEVGMSARLWAYAE